jgi:hypothetical protein
MRRDPSAVQPPLAAGLFGLVGSIRLGIIFVGKLAKPRCLKRRNETTHSRPNPET